MAGERNEDGDGIAPDHVKKHNDPGSADDPKKTEHLSGLSSQELDEVQE